MDVVVVCLSPPMLNVESSYPDEDEAGAGTESVEGEVEFAIVNNECVL